MVYSELFKIMLNAPASSKRFGTALALASNEELMAMSDTTDHAKKESCKRELKRRDKMVGRAQ